jgi:hypothetical protein
VLRDPVLHGLAFAAAGSALAFDLSPSRQAFLAGAVTVYAFARGGVAFFQTVAALRLPLPAAAISPT